MFGFGHDSDASPPSPIGFHLDASSSSAIGFDFGSFSSSASGTDLDIFASSVNGSSSEIGLVAEVMPQSSGGNVLRNLTSRLLMTFFSSVNHR